MVPILDALNVQCAVYGNHDFGIYFTALLAFACFKINVSHCSVRKLYVSVPCVYICYGFHSFTAGASSVWNDHSLCIFSVLSCVCFLVLSSLPIKTFLIT